MSVDLTHKYLNIKISSKGGAIFSVLNSALAISKAANCRLSLEFPQGYFIDIYPDSTLTDLQRIEELTNANRCLKEKLKEGTTT